MPQKTILCYGDSNTWGYVPAAMDSTQPMRRYNRSERWTGLLQILLGEKYYVVEEGLNSRTTNLDYSIPPDRNGKTYLAPCLYTHAPIDLVVLALGGNDLKAYFKREPQDICHGIAELVDIIQTSQYGTNMQSSPKILITTSPIPLPIVSEYTDENGVYVFKDGSKKAEALVKLYADLAKEKNCEYLDLSKVAIPSEIDGVHYDVHAHKKIAETLAIKIQSIL